MNSSVSAMKTLLKIEIVGLFFTPSRRRDVCCDNYEWINRKCTKCKIGTTAEAGGRCSSCQNDTYGEKCSKKCDCDQTQRCDAIVGCIPNTNTSTIKTTYTGPIEPTLLPHEKDTSNESTVTRNGAPRDDWIIYTLCITSCFFVTGFGHLFRVYIKRRSQKVGIIKKKGIPEPFTSYIGDFNKEDKTPIQFVTTGSNVTPKASHEETINFVCHERQSYTTLDEDDEDGNFDFYFDMKEDVDHQVEHHALRKECLSISSCNSIVVSQDKTEIDEPLSDYCQEDAHACEVSVTVHERQSYTACNEDDEAGYFDLYFDMKEDLNHEVEHHALPHKILSNNSFNSNVVSQDNTEFYEPLSEYCQEDPHACEVSVTVHERQYNTACNGDDEVEEAGYFYPYFDMKEDVNRQEEHHALPQKNIYNSSFNSKDVGQDDTEFLKPLSEYYQGGPDACEVSLSVNQCIERSSLSKEDAASNVYVNVYQLLQNDRQKNRQLANGNWLSPDSYSVRDKPLKTAIPSIYRTSYSQYCTNKYAESEITINACGSIESNKDKSSTEEKSKTI